MATQLEQCDLVSFKGILMANSIQVDTADQLPIKKGFFTEQEFFAKLKRVQYNHRIIEDETENFLVP
jgi:hypothetical protein